MNTTDKPYKPVRGPLSSDTLIVTASPSQDDLSLGEPFTCADGSLLSRILKVASLEEASLRIGTIATTLEPPLEKIDNVLTITPHYQRGIHFLLDTLLRNKPNIIVALGKDALFALTGEHAMWRYRGTLLPCKLHPSLYSVKVLATHSIKSIQKDWSLLQPVIMDFHKVKTLKESRVFPTEKLSLKIDASLEEFEAYAEFIATSSEVEKVSFDIETTYAGWYQKPVQPKIDSEALRDYHTYLENEVGIALHADIMQDTPLYKLVMDAIDGPSVPRKEARRTLKLRYGTTAPLWNKAVSLLKASRKLHYEKVACYAQGHLTWFGIGHSGETAMNIRFLKLENGLRTHRFTPSEELRAFRAIARCFSNKERKYIAQNGSFDIGFLWQNHSILVPSLWFDTMIAGHVIWPGLPKNLGFLSSMTLTAPAWKHTSKSDMGSYNALDVVRTFQIAEKLSPLLDKFDARKAFEDEMKQIPAALFLSLNGIKVDLTKRESLRRDSEEKKKKAEEKLSSILTKEGLKPINYGSPPQLKGLLYEKLKLPKMYARKKGQSLPSLTTDNEAIWKLIKKTGHPILMPLLDWKKEQKLISNYYTSRTCPTTGKHYTSYNITGTVTGRWSSSGSIIRPFGPGNLQNIPSVARGIYTPLEGMVILQADYIQAEAEVVAYLSDDTELQEKFKTKGFDLHKLTAVMMFRNTLDQVTKEQRVIGKRTRHAGNYDAGPKVLAHALKVNMPKAAYLLQLYHDANPKLLQWHQSVQEKLKERGTLTTALGRTRRFFTRWGTDLFREAYAFEPQSIVGQHLNDSLVLFYERYGHRWDILLQLHDAIYVATPPEDVEECAIAMKECMVRPITIRGRTMKLQIDYSISSSWGGMKPYKVGEKVTCL